MAALGKMPSLQLVVPAHECVPSASLAFKVTLAARPDGAAAIRSPMTMAKAEVKPEFFMMKT